jgi:uncharacterized membrane protein
VSTTRLEAFSDGVFAIAITLLVLDLAIGQSGNALHRVLDGWPFYLAYVVSFLTIGAAWLAHHRITGRLTKADSILLRLNLLVLLVISFLPFPTRPVAEGLHETDGERVYVTLYGLTLLAARVLLFALDEYARREHLYADDETDEDEKVREPFPRRPRVCRRHPDRTRRHWSRRGALLLARDLPGRPVQGTAPPALQSTLTSRWARVRGTRSRSLERIATADVAGGSTWRKAFGSVQR